MLCHREKTDRPTLDGWLGGYQVIMLVNNKNNACQCFFSDTARVTSLK